MVNLMKYRERADYADGTVSQISGREADDLYAPLGPLAAIGAEVVFFADVDQQLLGAAPAWDRVGVVKYPTRRSFIEMQSRPDFQRQHAHKEAGMEQTIVMGCLPMELPALPPSMTDVDWATVPHPPTAADPSVMVMHVIRYNEAVAAEITPESMESYQRHAAEVAGPHGVRLAGWLSVEGTIVGDGRAWDQVRFNAFPSKAAFMAVVLDPQRLAAQREFREPAMADTYALILRPTIDRIAESISAG
jgi:hypothetical protein